MFFFSHLFAVKCLIENKLFGLFPSKISTIFLCFFFNWYKIVMGEMSIFLRKNLRQKNHVRRNLPPIFVQQFTPNWWCGLVYSYTSIRVSMNLSTLIFFYLTFSYHEAYVSEKKCDDSFWNHFIVSLTLLHGWITNVRNDTYRHFSESDSNRFFCT